MHEVSTCVNGRFDVIFFHSARNTGLYHITFIWRSLLSSNCQDNFRVSSMWYTSSASVLSQTDIVRTAAYLHDLWHHRSPLSYMYGINSQVMQRFAGTIQNILMQYRCIMKGVGRFVGNTSQFRTTLVQDWRLIGIFVKYKNGLNHLFFLTISPAHIRMSKLDIDF